MCGLSWQVPQYYQGCKVESECEVKDCRITVGNGKFSRSGFMSVSINTFTSVRNKWTCCIDQ
jgi:hypothetical protein